ncbi:MAG TPA: hypothetical protein VFG73_07085 [Rhodanobacteraceae bacterium]|nr:hypothetical protein [Rhodanobacteraceae bacterium]
MSQPLDDFVSVSEVQDATLLAGDLFRRKFGLAIPEFPHHFVAFVRLPGGALQPACYTHATDCGDIALGGGACTDTRVLRRLDASQRERLRAVGGIYRYTLLGMLDQLRARFPVLFAYCGDALSERVMLATDFQPTGEPGLLAYWMATVTERRRAQMVAKARSFVPF